MSFVIGIDGGGTKTRGIVLNASGDCIADITCGPSNYQLIGISAAKETLEGLLAQLLCALNANGGGGHKIADIHFGLSGADLPIDFAKLNAILSEITGNTPFHVANDTWNVMRSALTQSWGAVSLYGTGANAAALGLGGECAILRALDYIAGGIGGGDEIATTALHYAFRADEGTSPSTALQTELPKLWGLSSMNDLLAWVYPHLQVPNNQLKAIPPLVFKLANENDIICKNILQHYGQIQGQLVAGMIRRVAIENLPVPVVIGGSVFDGECPLFVDVMMAKIKETAPLAYSVKPQLPPVAGAALLAAERARFTLTDNYYDQLKFSLKK